MSRHTSLKVSTDLVDQARAHAGVFQRSVGGQVEYWAKIGKAIESSPDFSAEDIARLLATHQVTDTAPTILPHPHWKVARFEAAIEVLGFQITEISAEIDAVKNTPEPDAEKIADLRARRIALADEQDDLRPDDFNRIAEILGDQAE